MALTDMKLQKAKGQEKQYRLTDGDGLYALVQPSGSIWWRFDYYRPTGGRNTMAFGTYPEVSLKQARDKRGGARQLVAAGIDPAEKAKIEAKLKQEIAADRFANLVDDYIDHLKALKRSEATIAKAEWLLRDLAAKLAVKPVREIIPADILPILLDLQAKGRLESAHRLRGILGKVYRFAIPNLRADNDPTWALRGALRPVQTKSYAAVVQERPYGALLRAIDDYDGWPTLKAALQIMALCYPRPGELRFAEWTHLDLDATIPVWTIPAHIAKMRREHDIPLSQQALGILENLKRITGNQKYVFPALRGNDRVLSECGMNAALRRLGYTKDEHTPHGFRSSASTILNGRRFDGDVIERSLAHLDENRVRRIYNRYEYWDERIALAQAWADICDGLKKRSDRRFDDLI